MNITSGTGCYAGYWLSIQAIAERLDVDEYKTKVILDKWREFLHLESIAAEIHYSCNWEPH
ncbi:hypothetical protein ANSO36C_10550 [Nostoc cf. commune SO-36]|uniref:Uncharacterized protein n=1 Tax=Nostoc cf. commune SO-36 TaxID=449208 RepID=A0ABM7YX74_NOSCO|nr:hypothetical protein [Nostoc commune]BDI15253.1 hypothetical protein ANSO36C_10550 [Nostoc cf. commune SO-36]